MSEKQIEAHAAELERKQAHQEQVRRARQRGVVALVGTAVVTFAGFALFRACLDQPGEVSCKVSSDCEGIIGIECLHAPTQTYCTHTCNRDQDCDQGMHCDSPPWEKGATRLLCLQNVVPANK